MIIIYLHQARKDMWHSEDLLLFPVERPVRWRRGSIESPGDALETRSGGTALVARTCASMRGAPERARRPRERPGIRRGHASCRGDGTSQLADHRVGQVTCIGLVGPFGQPRLTVKKVHGPCLPLPSLGVAIPLLLSECCGIVSAK